MTAALPRAEAFRSHSLPQRIKRLHMVGIGGTGMCGIAEVLLHLGFQVTGTDLVSSDATDRLVSLGARVERGHDAARVGDAQVLIVSSAVDENNPELREARRRNIPVVRRAEMLGELMRLRWGIAVCGTHGKSTTTALVGELLTATGFDPTIIVGGRLTGSNTGARVGQGEILVAEADEFDRSFLKLAPIVAVATNVEPEHLECYGSFAALLDAFKSFLGSVPFYGRVILSGDDRNLTQLRKELERPVTMYGLAPNLTLGARVLSVRGLSTTSVVVHQGQELGELVLSVPGVHNVKNALAALAVAFELGVPWEAAKRALEAFRGVRRRFEVCGEFDGVMLVDDYAHHPTELEATLQAARAGYPDRRLVALFQPHLYSRTQQFTEEFAAALEQADLAVITDVYGSREEPLPGVDGKLVVDALLRRGYRSVYYAPDKGRLREQVLPLLRAGDLLVTLGAGDIGRLGRELFGRGSHA